MTSKILQATINNKSNGFDVVQLKKRLDEARKDSWRGDKVTKKTSFSPSVVSGYHGTCPRYWHYAFNGAMFESKFRPESAAAMDNGTDSHRRIQLAYSNTGLPVEIEKEVVNDDPPIRGFADVIVTIDGKTAVGDIKTIKHNNYVMREQSMKPTPNHYMQVLIYMKVLGLDYGFMHYENKDTHEELFIPFKMTPRAEAHLEYAWDWMRHIYDEPSMPERVFNKQDFGCRYCPVSKECWKGLDGSVKIEKLKELKP